MDQPKPDRPRPTVLEDFIEHYGIPGMRWGHRRPSAYGPTGAGGVSTKETPGKRVKTSGGENQPASADAVKTAISKRIAKKSSTDALSNKELKDMVTRMNLEQQYNTLKKNPTSKVGAGGRFAQKQMLNVGQQQVAQVLNQQIGNVIKNLLANTTVTRV